MSEETLEQQMERIARDVSWKYARRCWWQDQRELEQQAWIVILEVRQHYAPLKEDGTLDRDVFGAWAYKAAMRQLSRWLRRESSPVSTSDHDVPNMQGVRRAPTLELDVAGFSPRNPEDLLSEKVLLRALETRILNLCGNTIYVRAALLVLMDNEKPAYVAQALGLEVWGIYRTTDWIKLTVRADSEMRKLAQELLERRMSE